MKRRIIFIAGVVTGYAVSKYKEEIKSMDINELMEQAREKLALMGVLPLRPADGLNGGAARLLADYEAKYGPVSQEEVDETYSKTIIP